MKTLAQSGEEKKSMILKIKDKTSLHNLYMPFVNGGGLFVPNHAEYDLGDEASIMLTLMDETEVLQITGKVVWVARKGVKSPHTPGVGIQLDDPKNTIKDKIETYLTGSLISTDTTSTM